MLPPTPMCHYKISFQSLYAPLGNGVYCGYASQPLLDHD
jgi:hypothetical protein